MRLSANEQFIAIASQRANVRTMPMRYGAARPTTCNHALSSLAPIFHCGEFLAASIGYASHGNTAAATMAELPLPAQSGWMMARGRHLRLAMGIVHADSIYYGTRMPILCSRSIGTSAAS